MYLSLALETFTVLHRNIGRLKFCPLINNALKGKSYRCKETKSYGGGWIGLLGDMMTMDANASRAFKNTMALCLVDNGWGVKWKR